MSHDMDVKNTLSHVSLRSDAFILDLQLMVEFLFHLITFKPDPRNMNLAFLCFACGRNTRLVNYIVSSR